jgi:putative ABC transport system permease protein
MANACERAVPMNDIIDLTILQVGLAYIFVLVVLAIVRVRGIRREKEIVISSLRMMLQLVLVGYILVYVFDNPSPWITVAIIVVMEVFAILTVLRKFRDRLTNPLRKVIAVAMSVGTLSCIMYFLVVVVRISPWYEPRYFVPIAGMLIGNSMTGISLGVKTLIDGMTIRKHLVEEALILGASPKAATRDIINSTFDSAIMPTINAMIGMGIVFLPGMMTGQILSGTDPTTAIAYQIAIMFGILGAVALTIIIMLQLGYRTFFNAQDQLNP